jgi:hypothetical protein
MVLALSALSMCSCNIIGPAALLIEGPPTTPAMHELAKEAPTVVFIDDRASRLGRRSLRLVMAEQATRDLIDRAGMTAMVAPRAALDAATGESPSDPTDLTTLTKNSQARVMVYATIDRFELSPDRVTFLPTCIMRVKVIDVATENPRNWPEEFKGHTLVVPFQQTTRPLPRSAVELAALEESVAQQAGQALARLFFKYETREATSPRN